MRIPKWQSAPNEFEGDSEACLELACTAIDSILAIGGMWAVVTAVETKPSLPFRKWKAPAALLAVNFGWRGGGLSKRKNAMTRAPFLFLSVIQCFPHSLPLLRLKQSIILGSVDSTAPCHNICAILIRLAHKTRPKTYARNASLSPQQQPPLILQVLCVPFPLVTFACTERKKAALTEGTYTKK